MTITSLGLTREDTVGVARSGADGVGGVITLWVVLFLLLAEIFAFCRLNHSEIITVRNSTDDTLFIDFNMTFYNISCGSGDLIMLLSARDCFRRTR